MAVLGTSIFSTKIEMDPEACSICEPLNGFSNFSVIPCVQTINPFSQNVPENELPCSKLRNTQSPKERSKLRGIDPKTLNVSAHHSSCGAQFPEV